MTIERTISSVSYVGNGATRIFDFAFPIPAGCLRVLQRVAGVESVVDAAAYSASGLGTGSGGAVTFVTAPAAGVGITITRKMVLTQTAAFATGQAFYPEVVEAALDRQIMIAQQLDEVQSRTPQMPQSYTGTVDLALPVPVAGRAIVWNATGTGLKNGDTDLDVLAAQAPLAIAAGTTATAAAAAAVISEQAAEQAAQAAQSSASGLAGAVLSAQSAQAAAERIRITMQSTVAAAVETATSAAQNSAAAMVQAAQSAQAAASSAASMASGAASSVTVQQTALDTAVASASASAITASNAAAQAATVAWLIQTTDYGFVDGSTTQGYDYGVLPS